ncbi:ABC transporter ATP-binding protein [uncultured Roseovarius sp.]|uniref:ABC transporter ATP-binding protein n=1 Tax=uncultured Roseovarius sp. TaxID=293344 RepID=UPI0026377827|nr:ABC transporter ATP-binding protein [uncultured Roseovarius sp.]
MTRPDRPGKSPLFSPRDRDNLRWLWHRYMKKRAPWLGLVLIMIIIQGVVYQQFLSITENGLRVIFENGTMRELALVCVAVFFLFGIRALMAYLVPRISVWVSNGAIYEMRRDLISHMMELDLAYFERTKSGEIIQRIVTQTQGLGHFIGLGTANAVRDAVTVVIVSGYLIWKNPVLFTAAVLVLPFIIWVMNFVSGRVKMVQAQAEQALGDYMNGIDETVGGMRTVKISSQEAVETARLEKGTAAIRDLTLRVQRTQALVMPSIDLSSAFVYVLVIGGGGFMVLHPDFDMDGAGIITFLLGMVLVFDPARLLAQFLGSLQSHIVLLDRVRGLYLEQPTIFDKPNATTSVDTRGDIVLDHVRFCYSDDQPLFDDLSITFNGGNISAIVGATGSGKSTILSLLSRLYDVQGGQITIGGTRIDKLTLAALRGAFSVVAQDIVIFNNSIWENIRYVNPDASDADIWRAAESAEISDLIRRRGDAPVGPKGAHLSGGQKQRIAIARAFLADAPILLLDEATSALDQATEARIKSALARLTAGRTTIMVAHRLSSIVDADCIYVLDAGRLVEQGTHSDLLAQGGYYSSLYETQENVSAHLAQLDPDGTT